MLLIIQNIKDEGQVSSVVSEVLCNSSERQDLKSCKLHFMHIVLFLWEISRWFCVLREEYFL